MTKTMRVLIAAVVGAAAASRASAQTPQQTPPAPLTMGFVNINVGAQAASRTVDLNQSFSLYNETATITSSQKIGSGALFDITGGYRVWRNVSAAIGFSNFSKSSDSTGAAVIPDPLIFNNPATINISQPKLDHSERAIHLQASWLFPVTNEFDVTLAVGPSIFSVKQEVISVTVPGGTKTANVSVGSESKSGVGVNFQLDGNYLLTRRYGVGAFIRYAGASVDLPSVSDLKVGGFQIGGGLRVRF